MEDVVAAMARAIAATVVGRPDEFASLSERQARAAIAAAEGAGYVLAPLSATDDMLIAAIPVRHNDVDVSENSRATWDAMIAARPSKNVQE